MKRTLILSLLFFSTNFFAQLPSIQWEKSLGGEGNDWGYSIVQTKDGGYIVAGASSSYYGDITGNHGHSQDFWVVKIDSAGIIQWQKSLGGSLDDLGLDIQQTNDGGYIVVGSTSSSNGDVTAYHGGGDAWAVKLDSIGNIQWQKSYGGTIVDFFNSVRQTSDGGYVLAGGAASQNGDVTGNHGALDYWIVKVDVLGSIQWQKSYGGQGDDIARCIRQTNDKGYVFVGGSYSTNGDVTGHHGTGSYSDYWVVKTDSSGIIQWQKSLGGTYEDEAQYVEQTVEGGYIISGHSDSNNGDVVGNHGGADCWVVKLSANGNLQWERTFGGTDQEDGYCIKQTIDNGYFFVGCTGSNNGDVSHLHGAISVYDYWAVKLDSVGFIQWQDCLGGSSNDVAYSGMITTDGGYIISGGAQSIDMDVTNHHDTVYTSDYWVVKLKSMPTGIETHVNTNNFSISPNPTTGTISITLEKEAEQIQITNSLGEIIQSFKPKGTKFGLELKEAGVYYVQVQINGIPFTKKVVVSK